MGHFERGFSIIELLIALAIFALLGVAMTGVLLSNMRNNGLAKEVTEATNVAQNKIEEFRGTITAPSAGSDTVASGGVTYSRSWTVANAAGLPVSLGLKNVAVTVRWNRQGVLNKSVVLSTFIGT